MKHRTEQVYDDEMAPLVAQLIEIAKREAIPMVFSAGMLDAEGESMTCDTLVLMGRDHPKDELALLGVANRCGLALEIMRGHSGFDTASALQITRHGPRVGGE